MPARRPPSAVRPLHPTALPPRLAAPAHTSSDESEPNHFTSGSRQEQPSPPTSGPVLSATRLLAVPRCVRQKQQQQVQPSPSPLSATAPPRAGSREGRRRRRDESLRAWAVSARAISIVSYTCFFALLALLFLPPSSLAWRPWVRDGGIQAVAAGIEISHARGLRDRGTPPLDPLAALAGGSAGPNLRSAITAATPC